MTQKRQAYFVAMFSSKRDSAHLKESSNKKDSYDENELSPSETVAKFTSIVAPVILPMIDALGDLQIEE